MTIVDEHRLTIAVAPACRALEISRATWYRRRRRETAAVAADRRRPPRCLPDRDRERIVEVLCSKEFVDCSPRAVYATLLDRGQYLCSIRTMYRVLGERHAVRERRAQRQHPQNAVPVCCARGPNELWSWDITKLAGPNRCWFSLYVILDVFSRYVVGWLVAARESAFLATRLIEQAIQTQGIDPSRLTIHADRGSPMKAKSLAQLLADLGIERSHSRPRVSNDNPFSEAQFKTLKYCSQYPGQFAGLEAAKTWCESFIAWYNHEHRHEAIGLFTPADVYTGRHVELTRARQHVLDRAYQANPERFVRGRPSPPVVPQEVWINRPDESVLTMAPPPRNQAHRALPGVEGFQGGRGRPPLVAAPETPGSAAPDQRRETHCALPMEAVVS